jgi:hypothetical protein
MRKIKGNVRVPNVKRKAKTEIKGNARVAKVAGTDKAESAENGENAESAAAAADNRGNALKQEKRRFGCLKTERPPKEE